MMISKRMLFLPVSSTKGMGEYVRSLCLAKELNRLYPGVELAFGLNKKTSYVNDCPFRVFLLGGSPTQVTPEVLQVVDSFSPEVVIFDASGRSKQLAHCRKKGVKTVFIAQHDQKLAKGLRFSRLRHTDAIIVAQPESITKKPNFLQRFWLGKLNKLPPVYVGPIFLEATEVDAKTYLTERALAGTRYVLVNAGGGGNSVRVNGKKILAADLFLEAAVQLLKETYLDFVVVMGKNYPKELPNFKNDRLRLMANCDEKEFNVLLVNASAAILSGGGNLLQAVAIGVEKVLAVSVAKDQGARISACVKAYGVETCKADPRVIPAAFKELIKRDTSSKRQNGANIKNGLHAAIAMIALLLDETARLRSGK